MRSSSGWSILPAQAGMGRCTLLLAFMLLLGACGDAGSSAPPPALGGPPRWRIADAPQGTSACAIHARSPCRIRLRMESADHKEEVGRWRDLAAGQTVRVNWSYDRLPDDKVEDQPLVDDRDAGRTESMAARVNCHFEDGPSNYRRLVFWARPGTGRVLHAAALPPGRYEELPAEGSIEILTVALVDRASGGGALKRRELRSRLVLPEGETKGDRHEVVRFFVDVAPAGAP